RENRRGESWRDCREQKNQPDQRGWKPLSGRSGNGWSPHAFLPKEKCSYSQVARVEHEGRSSGQRIDFRDRLTQGCSDIFVRFLVEADVAVADLDETQIRPGSEGSRVGNPAESLRLEDAAGHGPEDTGASPSHAVEETAAVNAVFVMIVSYYV